MLVVKIKCATKRVDIHIKHAYCPFAKVVAFGVRDASNSFTAIVLRHVKIVCNRHVLPQSRG